MKYFIAAAILLFSVLTVSMPGAQKLYTWTDENGILHITETPPPKNARVEEVTNYKERTPEDEAARRQRNEEFRRKLEKYDQRVQTQEAQLKAKEAEEEAQKAKAQAQQEYEDNKAYIDKLSNRKWKRKKFRKRITRLKKETEENFAEAEEAAKRAEEAKAKAEQGKQSNREIVK